MAHTTRADARRGEDFAHDLELVLGLFVDDQRPAGGQHGQQIAPPVPPFGIDLVRLRERGQVADGPGDDVAVAVQIAVALLPAPSTRAISRATEGFSASTAMVPELKSQCSEPPALSGAW